MVWTRPIDFDLAKKDDQIFLEPLSDIHVGSRAFAKDKFLTRVKAIAKDPSRHTLFMGDVINNIRWDDKRFDPDEVERSLIKPSEQSAELLKLAKPLKDANEADNRKIFGFIVGNHEWKTMERANIITQFCDPLKTVYLGYACYIYLRCMYKGEFLRGFTIFAAHGSYGGMQEGGNVNRAAQLSIVWDADCYLFGHTHSKWTHAMNQNVYLPSGDKAGVRTRLFANCGTFLSSYVQGMDTYPEKRLAPVAPKLGTITIGFDAYNGKMHTYE